MTSYPTPICRWCIHLNPVNNAPSTCNAFPNGIPDEIRFSQYDHRIPFPGDNGITYESDGSEPFWPVYFQHPDAITAGMFSRVKSVGHWLNWNPDLHPRGRDGQFIETGGYAAFDVPANMLTNPYDRKANHGRTVRLHGKVLDVVPDPKRPGEPDVRVEVFDPRIGQHVPYTLKPNKIDTIDVKAYLGGNDWSKTLDEQTSALRKVRDLSTDSEVERIAQLAEPSASFRADLAGDKKAIENATESFGKRWPSAPLLPALEASRRQGLFNGGDKALFPLAGHKTGSAITVNSGFHNDGRPSEEMVDASPAGFHLHEMGHALDDALRQDDRDLAIQLDAVIDRQDSGTEASPLGRESTYEFVAEALVDSIENGDRAKPSSQEVAAIFDQAYGPDGLDSPDRNPDTRARSARSQKEARTALLTHEASQLTDQELTDIEGDFSKLDDQEKALITEERGKRIEKERERLTPEMKATSTKDLEQLAVDDDATQILRAAAATELAVRAAKQEDVLARRQAKADMVNAGIEQLSTTDPEQRYADLEKLLGPLRFDTDVATDWIYDHLVPPDSDGGIYTPERQAQHEEMWNELLAQIEKADIPKDHDALVLGGLPGAGKTTQLKPGHNAEKYGVVSWSPDEGLPPPGTTHVSINPDAIKAMMVERGMTPPMISPKLGGLEGATFIHEESSYISKMFQRRLSDLGYNVVLDNILHSSSKMSESMEVFAEEGYHFRGLFTDIPLPESKKSIKDRYMMDALKGTGRFVPSSVIANSDSHKIPPSLSKNRDAFDELVAQDWFTDWMVVDNTGISEEPRNPRGAIIAEGHGAGAMAQEIYDDTPEMESTYKAALARSRSAEGKARKAKRTSWWGTFLSKIHSTEAAQLYLGDRGYELPEMHPGMEHPTGPEFGFPGGELPPGVEAPISVSDAPTGFI